MNYYCKKEIRQPGRDRELDLDLFFCFFLNFFLVKHRAVVLYILSDVYIWYIYAKLIEKGLDFFFICMYRGLSVYVLGMYVCRKCQKKKNLP